MGVGYQWVTHNIADGAAKFFFQKYPKLGTGLILQIGSILSLVLNVHAHVYIHSTLCGWFESILIGCMIDFHRKSAY